MRLVKASFTYFYALKKQTMKKFFGLLFIAIALIACSSDDDSGEATTSIAGTWKMTAFNTENAYDLNNDGTASKSVMDETNCFQNQLMLFNLDGTGKNTSNSSLDIELELVLGTTDQYEYTIDCISETEIDSFTYTNTNNEVRINVDGETFTATLSNNTLTYVVPGGFPIEVEDPSEGMITITEDITLIYTKQ